MRHLAIAVFVPGLLAAPAAAQAASKTFELEAFTSVDISSGLNAEISIGDVQSVRAESPRQEAIDELIVEVSNGKLTASTDWNLLDFLSFGERETTLFITVPALGSATASAGADINATGISGDRVTLSSSSGADIDAKAVAGKSLEITVSSGADIDVEGACSSAIIDVSSGASLKADKLECAEIAVNASSGSDADVFASASLKANASSGADIEVYGKPASVDEEASSGGEIDIKD